MSAAVVRAITSYLGERHAGAPGVDQLIEVLSQSVTGRDGSHPSPTHAGHLAEALSEVRTDEDDLLAAVGQAIYTAGTSLEWRVDDGEYYKPGAAVGDGYRYGNMHTVLATDDDFAMGLFLLAPDVDYRDHRHPAPEFYLNLTGGSRWRFDFGDWRKLPAGSVLWNEPGAVHATSTGTAPWLSVWAWLGHVDGVCEVV